MNTKKMLNILLHFWKKVFRFPSPPPQLRCTTFSLDLLLYLFYWFEYINSLIIYWFVWMMMNEWMKRIEKNDEEENEWFKVLIYVFFFIFLKIRYFDIANCFFFISFSQIYAAWYTFSNYYNPLHWFELCEYTE